MLYTANVNTAGQVNDAAYFQDEEALNKERDSGKLSNYHGYTMFDCSGDITTDCKEALCVLIGSLESLKAFNEACAANGVIQIAPSQTPKTDEILRLGFYMLDDIGTWAFTAFSTLEDGIMRVVKTMRDLMDGRLDLEENND